MGFSLRFLGARAVQLFGSSRDLVAVVSPFEFGGPFGITILFFHHAFSRSPAAFLLPHTFLRSHAFLWSKPSSVHDGHTRRFEQYTFGRRRGCCSELWKLQRRSLLYGRLRRYRMRRQCLCRGCVLLRRDVGWRLCDSSPRNLRLPSSRFLSIWSHAPL